MGRFPRAFGSTAKDWFHSSAQDMKQKLIRAAELPEFVYCSKTKI